MSHEFIEHHNFKNKFITDIWYNAGTHKYNSVVSDLERPEGFSTIDDTREYLTQIMEAWSNGEQ